MKEIKIKRHCKNCKKETVQLEREDALEIEYLCSDCNMKDEVIKSFF